MLVWPLLLILEITAASVAGVKTHGGSLTKFQSCYSKHYYVFSIIVKSDQLQTEKLLELQPSLWKSDVKETHNWVQLELQISAINDIIPPEMSDNTKKSINPLKVFHNYPYEQNLLNLKFRQEK